MAALRKEKIAWRSKSATQLDATRAQPPLGVPKIAIPLGVPKIATPLGVPADLKSAVKKGSTYLKPGDL